MPEFVHYTFVYDNNELDIIHIKYREQQYYLKKGHEERGGIAAVAFYERIGDNNRLVVNDAVFDAIYRKKFGLHKTPFKKACLYLKDTGSWKYDYNEKINLIIKLCFKQIRKS